MKVTKPFVFALATQIFWTVPALATLPKNLPVPGGVAVVYLKLVSPEVVPKVTYQEKPIAVLKEKQSWVAVLGVPLDHQIQAIVLKVKYNDKTYEQKVNINEKAYPVESFKINPATMNNIESEENIKRLKEEKEILGNAFKAWQQTPIHSFALEKPVNGPIVGVFGARRIINGETRSAHRGVDIDATLGTPVLAAKEGKVIATGHYLLTGKTVLIEHGQGFKTVYCHLDQINVKKGNYLKAGQMLGKVGNTGRSSGPHLHFGVSLNNERVDPLLFYEN